MDLNQVTLPVRDMALATAFYRRLGFLQIVDTPHYARFECSPGGASFSLALDDSDFRNGAVIYFECEDLDQRVAVLQEKGVEFSRLPEDMRWLWREAVLYDPSGNKIKLYWAGENRLNPPWRVTLSESPGVTPER
ncbi:VOC family protein [Microbulbifer aggregans]|uniref:VOC family protein n=1 Tax=Microbulbifer aggregans TaxID=1769779 RepID=UPI001CFF1E73|nr:VOC family protein [Microbulbifer aggregans]